MALRTRLLYRKRVLGTLRPAVVRPRTTQVWGRVAADCIRQGESCGQQGRGFAQPHPVDTGRVLKHLADAWSVWRLDGRVRWRLLDGQCGSDKSEGIETKLFRGQTKVKLICVLWRRKLDIVYLLSTAISMIAMVHAAVYPMRCLWRCFLHGLLHSL